MELIDRAIQRQLLERIGAAYPDRIRFRDLAEVAAKNVLEVNLSYLNEHDLIRAESPGHMSARDRFDEITITKDGIDFLADDGGLTAILGVVTVRLHEDTLKELVAAKIRAADLPAPEKQKYLDQLRSLPADATKHLVLRLLDAGLDNWHRAWPLLQSSLGG